jgi:hypothetical protein
MNRPKTAAEHRGCVRSLQLHCFFQCTVCLPERLESGPAVEWAAGLLLLPTRPTWEQCLGTRDPICDVTACVAWGVKNPHLQLPCTHPHIAHAEAEAAEGTPLTLHTAGGASFTGMQVVATAGLFWSIVCTLQYLLQPNIE